MVTDLFLNLFFKITNYLNTLVDYEFIFNFIIQICSYILPTFYEYV